VSPPVRVLVVDDSVVVRRIVKEAIDASPGLEVIGTSSNGRLALLRIPLTKPDVVLLDIAMPELDGLATVKQLRASGDDTPVVIFSSMADARTAVEAVTLGANECIAKPTSKDAMDAKEFVMKKLAPVLRTLGGGKRTSGEPKTPAPVSGARSRPSGKKVRPSGPPAAIVIASSTGGPNALGAVIPKLPADFPVPVLIVQHMPPTFTGILAERLDQKSAVRVVEGAEGMKVEPGTVYIAPGGHHMEVTGSVSAPRLLLHDGPEEQNCRPAADVLFRSAARLWGGRLFGVVMTGMGADGVDGSRALTEAGARVITQDEASCVVYGMPRQVFVNGLSERAVALDEIADVLVQKVAASRGVKHARAR